MELQEIIKTDNDRLFIVDPECYIIFTGTSINDDKPFIRIGTWMDMPIELIPLIENIVIPDAIIGNPSGEQFNIDIKTLSANRYIGTRDVVKRYLEFQKLFGLDLLSANVVDVETDIPELSKERNISERNQFIGVFYKDGNFKTVHDSNNIIDLKDMGRICKNYDDLHDEVSRSSEKSSRYSGHGLIIIGHNPLFFSKGSFISYLFPTRYLHIFSRLDINPDAITELIHPSMSLLNLTRFIKWRRKAGKHVTVITDHKILIQRLRRLLPGLKIRQIEFSECNVSAGGGSRIENYAGTYNIKITYRGVKPSSRDLTVVYCKTSLGIKKILHDKPDALFITYSAFEDSVMLLRTSSIPYVVIDDGNKNISKIKDPSIILLRPNIPYKIESYDNPRDIAAALDLPKDLIPPENGLAEWLPALRLRLSDSEEESLSSIDRVNALAMISLLNHSTAERDIAAACKNILSETNLTMPFGQPGLSGKSYMVRLMLYGSGVYVGISLLDEVTVAPVFDDVTPEDKDLYSDTINGQYFDRIINDRERLAKLLSLFTDSEKFHAVHDEGVRLLKKEIEKRKNLSLATEIIEEEHYRKIMLRGKDMPAFTDGPEPDMETPSDSDIAAEKSSSRKKRLKIIGILAGIVFLLVIVSFFTLHQSGVITEREKDDPLARKLSTNERTFYEKKYNIIISNRDIFAYANHVAAKNGYNPIPYQTMHKGKNPDWIYPKNVFQMTDGEQVVVKEGDTLWDLSRDKLIRMTVLFRNCMDSVQNLTGPERQSMLKQARAYAFTQEQYDAVDALLAEKKGENEKGRK